MWAVALQLLACVLAFMLAKGTRLGAARPEHKERHRSTLEYLSSFAALTRKAGVESELLAELGGAHIFMAWPNNLQRFR